MPDSIEIMPANGRHAGDIRRLILKAGINPLGLNWRRFLVALNERGDVLGCGQLKPHGEEVVELASLVVADEWRNRGVGRKLIEHLIERAEGPLWLMCRSTLVPLYAKFGFEEVDFHDEQPGYFVRIRRLASILRSLTAREEYLAVMVLRN